jgi:hypothetical protein
MRNDDPKALREVWEWKERAYREVEHLPARQAVRKRLEDSIKAVRAIGLPTVPEEDTSKRERAKT